MWLTFWVLWIRNLRSQQLLSNSQQDYSLAASLQTSELHKSREGAPHGPPLPSLLPSLCLALPVSLYSLCVTRAGLQLVTLLPLPLKDVFSSPGPTADPLPNSWHITDTQCFGNNDRWSLGLGMTRVRGHDESVIQH